MTNPTEQQSFSDDDKKSVEGAGKTDRRDLETEIQTGQPGDADVNLDTQGRFGNIKQNLTNQNKG